MQKPKILIIDDDAESLELLQEYFEDEFEILATTSTQEALEMYNSTVECVLLDYLIDEMNGIEIADELNKRYVRPTILITAYGSEKLSIQEYQKFFSVVTKPLNFSFLADTVHRAVIQYRTINRERLTAEVVLNNTLEGIFTFDEEGKILSWNQAAQEIFGYTVEEVYQKPLSILFKTPMEIDECRESLKTSPQLSLEIGGKTKQGEEIPLTFSACPLKIGGKKEGYVASCLNISELKAVREQLSDSKARLTALSEITTRLLDYLPMALAVIDLDKKVTSCTRAFRKTFHIEAPDISEVNVQADEIFNQEQINKLDNALQGKAGIYEGRINVDGAKFRWHRERFDPLIDDNQHIVGAIVIDEDITHHHEKQKQMVHVEKMGALGTLASGVSHEYNNLFTSIYGSAELILYSKPSKEIVNHANRIIQTVQRATKLTNQLLNFVSIQEIHLNQVNLGEVVGHALDSYNRDGEGVAWNVEISDDLPLLYIDRGLVEEAIMVLLSNAEHAVLHGSEKTITIRMFTERDHLVISIKDSGEGIPSDNLNKIFEPFFTTKGALGGSDIFGLGLGLSIADTIVRKHGGHIKVHSEVNEGSEFQIHLPIETEEEVGEE